MEAIEQMTKYEIISTVISITALALSILIPLLQWIWRKWIITEKVKYYSTSQANLFFNQSGAYMRIYGIVESERKSTTIKKLKIIVTRKRDDQKLNLTWSSLISPVSQNMLGNYIQTLEVAHPFRVEADSIACAFVEYSDFSDSSGIKIRSLCANLASEIQEITPDSNYDQAIKRFSNSSNYLGAKSQIANDFFWEAGKYAVDIVVEYGKRGTKSFPYEFSISEKDYFDLQKNIDEILIAQLKSHYGIRPNFHSPMIEISERKIDI